MEHPEIKWLWDTTSGDDIVNDFYRPALENAVFYQRKAGYFSSTTFVEISTEMINFIERNGRMQLITSPNLSTYDKKLLEDSIQNREKILSEIFLEDLKNDPDGTKQHFAKLMAYMLTNQIDGKPQLEIKIALTDTGKGIFHNKSGIITQKDGEMIAFLGSNNETGSAWDVNDEEFTAICSWNSEQEKKQAASLQQNFENLWNQNNTNTRLFDLPDAIKNELLKISPKSTIEYQDVILKIHTEINIRKKNIVNESSISENKKPDLFDYQKIAIEKWLENNHRGIFSMATGTGKTFAAFGAINKFTEDNVKCITIIACPQTHLVEQWYTALKQYNSKMPTELCVNFDDHVICYSEKNWEPKIKELLYDFNRKTFSGKSIISNFIIFITHATLNSQKFKKFVDEMTDAKILLVVDEMHNIGSELSLDALLDRYDYRLGLSATPMRHYDEEGSNALMKYFEKIVFEYPLSQAIHDGILCKYYYHPIYAELTHDEMAVYNRLTGQIAAKMGNKKIKKDENDQNDPANQRAALVGNAENKLAILEEICEKLNWSLDQTLIYCTSHPSPNLPKGSKTQLQNVDELLAKKHVTAKSITYDDSTKNRGEILKKLAVGHYDVVTAVKCLDEGVDIPSVKTAIIMASSGNPKQYVQRRGRVLRRDDARNKEFAIIYDILVKPPKFEDKEIQLRERKLLARELLRHQEFAKDAINGDDAEKSISKVREYYQIPKDLTFDTVNNLE